MKAGGHKKIKVGQRTRRWPCAPFAGNFFCLACEFVPLLKLPPRACPGATGKNVCMIVSFLLSCLDHWASIVAIITFAPGRDLQGLGHWRWSLPPWESTSFLASFKGFPRCPTLVFKVFEGCFLLFFCFYVYFSLTFINGPPTTLISQPSQPKWVFLGLNPIYTVEICDDTMLTLVFYCLKIWKLIHSHSFS